jgi:ubiquinone/menaquinone biosynthesis C-methylase UbiE
MAWYERLFDTEDPHRLGRYAETERSRQEVDFIIERLGIEPGARILDLCCGQGRHMVDLLRRGYDVVGVDLSTYMLNHCREALKAAGVHSCLVQSDMREINFLSEFDGIINMFTSFGYLESDAEDQKALNKVSLALKPGGRFLIDMINRDSLICRFAERIWSENERGDLLLNESRFDVMVGRIISRELTVAPDGSVAEQGNSIRLYTYNEIEKMLKCAGMSVEFTYGEFDSSPFSLDSKRMLVVARKA